VLGETPSHSASRKALNNVQRSEISLKPLIHFGMVTVRFRDFLGLLMFSAVQIINALFPATIVGHDIALSTNWNQFHIECKEMVTILTRYFFSH